MRSLVFLLAAALALGGCSHKSELPGTGAAPTAESKSARHGLLAYEHNIRLEVEDAQVVPLQESAIAACRDDAANDCALLESSVNTGRNTSAFLKLRAKPDGIRKLVALLGAGGTIVNKSVRAEDLAAPIGDVEKKLAQLTDYRDRLLALAHRGSNDVDALVKLNREIAQVQSDIEAVESSKATLVRRVDTELLSVSIDSLQTTAFWSPITAALRDFGGDLSRGTAGAITAVAYLAPWLLILLPLVWGVRRLWRRKKNAAAQ